MALDALPEAASVRAGADARIVAITPVSEVVAALLAWPGVVADLIGGEAGRRGASGGQLVERRGAVGIESLQLTRGGERGEARAGLDGQLVQRQMGGAERQCLVERRAPRGLRIAGQSVNQIEADAGEALLGNGQRIEALASRMGTAEEGEALVVEALKAERQP